VVEMFGIEGERGGIDRIENDSVDRIDGDGAKKASTVVRSEHKTTMMMEFSAVRESKGKNIICPSPEMPNFVKTERNTLFKD